MKIYIFTIALVFNVAAEQDFSSLLQGLDKNGMQDLVNQATHLDPSKLGNIEEGEEMFRERCLKNGNNDTYEEAKAAKDDFQRCVKGLVNIEQMQEEIEKAKPSGDLDTVFKKYCRKSPILRGCVSNLTSAIEPCLAEHEKTLKDTAMNVTNSLINFICYKEGDRIALFMAEGGPECLMNNIAEIQECLNATYNQYIPDDTNLENTSLPEIRLDEDQCLNINEVQACVVRELEKCPQPTPANIVDSMIKFIKKSTPCAKYAVSMGQSADGTSHLTLSLVTLVVSLVVAFH